MSQQSVTYTVHVGEFLPEVSEFVARVYHSSPNLRFTEDLPELTEKILAEDEALAPNTTLLCAYDESGELCSSARLIRRGGVVPRLPFEREFGMDLDAFENRFATVHEFSRLASTSRNRLANVGELLWQMYLRSGIDYSADLMVAGIDQAVRKVLRRRGWPIFDLGFGREYLGSLTIPVGIGLHALHRHQGRGRATATTLDTQSRPQQVLLPRPSPEVVDLDGVMSQA